MPVVEALVSINNIFFILSSVECQCDSDDRFWLYIRVPSEG